MTIRPIDRSTITTPYPVPGARPPRPAPSVSDLAALVVPRTRVRIRPKLDAAPLVAVASRPAATTPAAPATRSDDKPPAIRSSPAPAPAASKKARVRPKAEVEPAPAPTAAKLVAPTPAAPAKPKATPCPTARTPATPAAKKVRPKQTASHIASDDDADDVEHGAEPPSAASAPDPDNNPDDSYKVGYGKPPKDKQFQPGKSGNPKGRPRGSKSIDTIMQEVARVKLKVKTGRGTKRLEKIEVALHRLADKAASGDLKSTLTMLRELRSVKAEPADKPATPPTPLSATDQAVLELFAEQILEDARRGATDDPDPTTR